MATISAPGRTLRVPVPVPYPEPAGASAEGAKRANYLCTLRLSKYIFKEKVKYQGLDQRTTLEGIVQTMDTAVKRKRFKPETKNVRNSEYLISLILEAEGFADAIPDTWNIPRDDEPVRKRPKVVQASSSSAPQVFPMDFSGSVRYCLLQQVVFL